MRNLPIAWKSLGSIFDLSMIQSQVGTKGRSQDPKAARLHAIFKVLLANLLTHKKKVPLITFL
jgi:hypothetical protein